MMHRLRMATAIVGIACLTFIIFATLSPIGSRPQSGEPADVERFLAFLVLVALFAIAWPRRWVMSIVLIIVGAGMLEAAQNLLPDRHGRPSDFMVKAAGACAGALLGLAINLIAEKLRPGARER